RRPLVVAGDGVARSHALAEMVRVAERLGARVHGEPIYRRTVFPSDHALWRGGLFPTVPAVRKAFDNADAVLVVGASMFTWFLHAPGSVIPPGLPVIQVGDDGWEIGKSHRVSIGIVADVGATLRALERALDARMSEEQKAASRERLAELARQRVALTEQ